jgi:FHA domain
MTEMQKTRKLCPNGHEMDPAWDVCPYCPSDRKAALDPALARTVKVDDHVAPPPPPPSLAAAPRKTEIMDRPPSIDGIGWFVATAGASKGTAHRIDDDRVSLGASVDCDVMIDGNHVSDRHASLRFRESEFWLTDLDSTNGTWVNGDRIAQARIDDGDRVKFGSSEWVFKCVIFETA